MMRGDVEKGRVTPEGWREFYVERVRDRALPFFFRDRKVGALLHIKRRFCVVQQKESRHVCKILFKAVKILPNKQIALSGL